MSMSRARQGGFTLIELIFFIVVVSVAMAGILSVTNTAVKSSADPMVRKQSLAIAQSLLEEIVLKEYSKPNGSTVSGYKSSGQRSFTTASPITTATSQPVELWIPQALQLVD